MFLEELLEGLSDVLPSTETRYVNAPKDTAFAVWDAAVTSVPADCAPARREYEAVVTLVEPPTADGSARRALEAALDEAAVDWSHDRRGWSEAERVYATDYTITWAEKATSKAR